MWFRGIARVTRDGCHSLGGLSGDVEMIGDVCVCEH